jgi:hypothetical protein
MELMDLIQMAASAQDVLDHLRAYGETLRAAATLPEWWLQLPLENPEDARQRMAGLVVIVNNASRHLDDRRCIAGKQALHVYAISVWKLNSRPVRTAKQDKKRSHI